MVLEAEVAVGGVGVYSAGCAAMILVGQFGPGLRVK